MVIALVIACLVVLAGLVLLGVLTWRLWGLVRDLGRSVGRAGEQLAQVSDRLASVPQMRQR